MDLKDDKMSTALVGKLMLSLGIPIIVSMVLQAFYNIVDSAFVSNMQTGGEEALNALTPAFPLQVLMVAVGMRDAITPITAFSYGMRDNKRIGKCVKYGLLYTSAIMLFSLIVLEIFAVPFSEVFGLSGETQSLCISVIRVISTVLVFAGVNIAFQGVFQAVGSGIGSLLISLFRQLIFVFPFAIIFAQTAKSNAQMN